MGLKHLTYSGPASASCFAPLSAKPIVWKVVDFCETIVQELHVAGLAGVTVQHGPMRFGPARRVNAELNVEAPGNLPVVEIILIADGSSRSARDRRR